MIQIKDYAKEKHVTYEAVRKQIKRYEVDLEGHIIRQGNTQFLDDEAVKFLDEKRAENPVIASVHEKDLQIRQLQEENSSLKIALVEAQHNASSNAISKEILYAQEQLVKCQNKAIKSLEKTINYQENINRLQERLLKEKDAELETLKKERNALQKKYHL